ncbi:MAG: alpha/beta hydrolase [Bacteriovorax sp.]
MVFLAKYKFYYKYKFSVFFCIANLIIAFSLNAATWLPAEGHTQTPIWSVAVPDSRPATGPEDELTKEDNLVAGKPWYSVANVTQPTFTIYAPKTNNTGAAVVVFPGGGYRVLAIDLEGTEICDWLTSNGITCVLLKYRVPGSGPHWDPKCKCHVTPKVFTALQDAQRTIRLIRSEALRWKIDPHKIGVIGFSAGGHLVAAISTNYHKIAYKEVDAADKVSCRPDFAIALYPGHMSIDHDNDLTKLNPNIHVTSQTPPTFLLHAENDPVDPVEYSTLYYAALKKAGVPVEMHLYAQGKLAFGLRHTEFPITQWPQLVNAWLESIKIVQK